MNLDDPLLIGAGDAAALAAALHDTRQRLLPLIEPLRALLGTPMDLRYLPELSPPRWQLGHLAWLEDWWIGRNPLRGQGLAASADAPRGRAVWAFEDAALDPRPLSHSARWHQASPALATALTELARRRQRSLALLAEAGRRRAVAPAALLPWRALLWHEEHECALWLGLAQTLGAWPEQALPALPRLPEAAVALSVPAGDWALGSPEGPWCAPDEAPAHTRALDAFEIDAAAVTWARFLPFIEAGGYDDPAHWSPAGWSWRQRQGAGRPRHLGLDDAGQWQVAHFGRWVPLDTAAPAIHLSRHEAEAWCRWAGRRLPGAAEWEVAARHAPGFAWGAVQEWTATLAEAGEPAAWAACSLHAPRPQAGMALVKGASFAQGPRLHRAWAWAAQPPEANAGFWGFRSCAGAMPPAGPAAEDAGTTAPAARRKRGSRRPEESADAAPPEAAATPAATDTPVGDQIALLPVDEAVPAAAPADPGEGPLS